MHESLLILGAGQMQLPAIRLAKAQGLRVICIDPQADAPGLSIADEAHVSDLGDEALCLSIAKAGRIDGVMTLAAEYPIPTVARIASELGLPGISPETATNATDKQAMRQCFSRAGVPSPRSIPVTEAAEARSAFAELGGPAIVKPARSHGGRGITCLAAGAAPALVDAAFAHAMDFTRSGVVLVEEFVDGPEFSLEGVTLDGETHIVAVTDKTTSGAPHFVELGHCQPSRWPESDIAALIDVARRGVAALGIDWAPSHSELKLTPSGPVVIEIGARLGGGYITSHLVPLSCGVDLVGCAIDLALGRQPALSPRHRRGAAVRFVTAKPGRIQGIRGVSAARALSGVEEVSVYCQEQDEVLPLRDATGRVGHVIASAESADAAADLADAAHAMIVVDTHPN